MTLRMTLATAVILTGMVLLGTADSPAAAAEPQGSAKVKLQPTRDNKYPPAMPGATREVFKKVGDTELALYIYQPADTKPTEAAAGKGRPAIVFFFGGGWNAGSPSQFHYQSQYLASRGMTAICADYRVRSRNQSQVVDSLRDAKSAIRYVRTHAGRLGIDADRIVAAGGSAGGHLAACTALIKDFDEPSEDAAVSSAPNALVLFNPAVALVPKPGQEVTAKQTEEWMARAGVEPRKISPASHIRAGLPPTLTLIGTADGMYDSNVQFIADMVKAGNQAEIEAYEKMPHGFFNVARKGGNEMFLATLERTDKFLASLGYLSGPPAVAAYFE